MLIYLIKNKLNGKSYIGKTTKNLKQRIKQHIILANSKSRKRYPIHKAIKKYGIESFDIEILLECSNEKELSENEVMFIKEYNTVKEGYNCTYISSGGNIIKDLPKKRREEIYKKNAESRKGRITSEETKRKISRANKGKIRTKEARENISHSKRKENHPLWKKKRPEDVKEKIRKSNIGKNLGKTRSKKWKDERSKKYSGEGNPRFKKVTKEDIDIMIEYYSKEYNINDIYTILNEKYSKQKIRRTLEILKLYKTKEYRKSKLKKEK